MDYDSSTKFISSLAKFLQSLCNGYVEFDSGVQVIGHLYLSVDTGKTIDYILNEKVCKTDENSVTFISNSFHAQPAERPKAQGKKIIEKDSKPEDANDNQTSLPEPKSTNFGTLPTRGAQNSPHSQNFKRAFSPSSKRTKDGSSPSKLGRLSPKHKKNRTESLDQNVSSQISNPASENSISSQPSPTTDGITAPISAQSTEAVHGSQYTDSYQQNFFQTGEDDNSMVDESEERDIKPSIDTDVTFIKEEFAPSSCSQSSNQNRDRSHGEDSSVYYHSNQTFPASFAGQTGFGGTVRTNFNSSSERSSLYPGSSQLEAENSGDPSVECVEKKSRSRERSIKLKSLSQWKCCSVCHEVFDTRSDYKSHVLSVHVITRRHLDTDCNSNQLKFLCAFCPEPFVNYYQFSQHIARIGSSNSLCVNDKMSGYFHCAACDLDSSDIYQFRNHILQEHPELPRPNEQEGCVESEQSEEKATLASVRNRFLCYHCDNTYSDMKGLKRHLAKVNGVTFWCELCHKTFSRDDVFRKHQKTVHNTHVTSNK